MARKTAVEESLERLAEEKIYERVYEEVASGTKREGLWFKALSESGGEKAKAEALYVKLRVRSLIDELIVTEQIHQDEYKAQQDEYKEATRYNKKMLQAAGRQSVFDGIRSIIATLIFLVAGILCIAAITTGTLAPLIGAMFFGGIGFLILPSKR